MILTDVLMVSATALSPLIAVQVTRYLDDCNEERGRKLSVFKTLMATRAYTLSPAHVEALNRIDLGAGTKGTLPFLVSADKGSVPFIPRPLSTRV